MIFTSSSKERHPNAFWFKSGHNRVATVQCCTSSHLFGGDLYTMPRHWWLTDQGYRHSVPAAGLYNAGLGKYFQMILEGGGPGIPRNQLSDSTFRKTSQSETPAIQPAMALSWFTN